MFGQGEHFEYAVGFQVQGPGDTVPHPCLTGVGSPEDLDGEIARLQAVDNGFIRTGFVRLRRPIGAWTELSDDEKGDLG